MQASRAWTSEFDSASMSRRVARRRMAVWRGMDVVSHGPTTLLHLGQTCPQVGTERTISSGTWSHGSTFSSLHSASARGYCGHPTRPRTRRANCLLLRIEALLHDAASVQVNESRLSRDHGRRRKQETHAVIFMAAPASIWNRRCSASWPQALRARIRGIWTCGPMR